MLAHPTSPVRRVLAAAALVVAVVALGFWLAPGPTTSAQTPGPAISLDKTAPANALAGANFTYELTATNSGDTVEYNISFSDALPADLTYVPGSASPANAGAPTIGTDPLTGDQVLVWRNLADLQPGESYTLRFDVAPSGDAETVGVDLVNTAYTASQTDPRFVPSFGPDGQPVPGSFTESATDSASTTISPLEITKSTTNSPEGELLRGVHDQRALTTLTVRNSNVAATDTVVVVDHLPAGLEFLACGDVDNTEPPSAVEYPGAPRLGDPAFGAPPSCITPVSVETVTDPPPAAGVTFPPGVYTKVTWEIGDLAAGATFDVSYVTGIPLRLNTDDWPNGKPDDASLAQGANLDNNTGASTRELAEEGSVTNYAAATGDYTGNSVVGPDATASTSETLAVEDVRMRKAVSPEEFSSGVATFTIVVDVSEYVSASDVVVTDVLPDGYCPLSPGDNFSPDAAAECGTGGSAPSPAFESVTYDATDGTYTIVFETLPPQDPNGTVTVTFDARMRDRYTGDPLLDRPTVAGDSFTNNVSLTATTTPVDGTGETGEQTVGDTSSATQTTAPPALDKTMKPRYTPMDCDPTVGETYGEPSSFTDAERTFRKGDIVCFKLRVDFPSEIFTRDATITDFLPPETTYVTGSATPTANNTVTIDTVAESPVTVVWTVGDEVDGSLFVSPGSVFEAVFSAEVTGPAPPPVPDILGNLQKVSYADTEGNLFSLRDDLSFDLAPPPDVTLDKGVYEVDAPASGPNAPDTDGESVRESSVATFRIDVQNLVRPGSEDAPVDVRGLQTWDVLPGGITCAAVGNFRIVTGGTVPPATALTPAALDPTLVDCTDPGDPGHPTVDAAYGDSATQSILRWTFPSPDPTDTYSIDVGESLTLLYDMTLPSEISVSTVFTNAAAVRSYDVSTDVTDGVATYFPADNIDATVPPGDEDAPAADDTSFVQTPDATITKTRTTSVDETNNDLTSQATIGETVTWTVGVTIPARTTVYDATLVDTLPTGITFLSATAGFSATGASPATDPLPGGVTQDPATGNLTFPATYQNATDDPQRFEIVLTTRVSTLASNTNGTVRTNSARFSSDATLGGDPLPERTATTTVTIVEPSTTLTKTASPTEVLGGQTVTYRLAARNLSTRPPLHDASLVDCIPAEVTFDAVVSNNAGAVATEPGDGTNGCATGTTKLSWSIGTIEPAAANEKVLEYTGIVDPAAVGGASYTNTAEVTGSSIDDGDPTPTADERTYTSSDDATITVTGQTVTKGVLPATATIGEQVTYTVAVAVPADTTYYEAAIVDTVPAGLDVTAPNFTTVSVTCEEQSTSNDCAATLDPAFGTPLTTSGQKVAWYVGDVTPFADTRIVTVTYTTVVLDVPGNTFGGALTNSAEPRWSDDPAATTPVTADDAAALPQSSDPATADLDLVEPQLTIAKSVDDATPAPGDTFGYQVVITNGSDATASEAFDVSATDDVPAGVVVDPGSISNGGVLSGTGASGNGTITWTGLGDLSPGASITLTYSATLADSALIGAGTLTNTAGITSYFSLPSGNDDRREYEGPDDTADVTPDFPTVSVTKSTPDGDVASLEQPFAWELIVTNPSDTTAFAVDVTDTLPPNWTYDVASAQITIPLASGSPSPLEPTVGTVGTQQTLTWEAIGDLAPGASARITFTATPTLAVIGEPGVGRANPSVNTAQAIGEDATGETGNADGDYSEGPDTAEAVILSSDLALAKTATPSTVEPGGAATFTVDVTNNGPDEATGPFTVTDTVPDGLTLTGATGSGWSCTIAPGGGSLSCENATPTLAAASSLPTITVTASVPSGVSGGTVYTNVATVNGGSYDPDTDNNTDDAEVTVEQNADLELTKTTASTVVAGEDVSYVIAVRNNGPDTSVGSAGTPITVADTLPAGLTLVTAGGTGWTCGGVGQVVVCEYAADIDAGTNAPTITVVATLDPSASGDLTNTANVTPGSTLDPDPDNNTDEVTDTVDTSADLAIVKSHTAEVAFGDTFDFTLEVTNNGPSDAQNVQVTDTLPAGLTYVSATGTDWTCDAVDQDVTCDLTGPLAAEATTTITLTVTAGADAVPSVTNTATVTSTTDDPDVDNNTDDDTVDVAALVDLAITKTHAGDAVIGSELTFTLTVTNNGPTLDPGPITVTDTLPAGLTFVSASGPGWLCGAVDQDVTCTRLTGLLDSETSEISLVVEVTAESPGTLTNTATVTSPAEDTDPDNNTDSDDVDVFIDADLQMTKTTTTAPVVAGSPLTYSLVVRNNGPQTVQASLSTPITVVDTLPAGVTFVSATGTGWTCDEAAGVITCERGIDLIADANAPAITVTVDVPATTPADTDLTNSATVDSDNIIDPTPENNTDEVTDTVTTSADLAIVKSHTAEVAFGDTFDFALEVTNNGPSDAQNVQVTDDLPAGLTYVSATGTGWTCDAVDQAVTCDLAGPLAAEATTTITLTVTAGAAAVPSVTNTAAVTSSTPDPDPGNNTDDDTVDVAALVDLAITKTHAGDAVIGSEVTFTLAVSNNGPTLDPGPITVTDTLPAGLTYVTAVGSGWSCSATGQDVTCTRESGLGIAEETTISLITQIATTASGTLTNTATVTSPAEDTDPGNNTDSDELTLASEVKLNTRKTGAANASGTQINWTISVTNAGPSPTTGAVTVTDTLPAGVTFVSGTGTGWTCTGGGQVVTCTNQGVLTVGATSTVTVLTNVDARPGQNIVNAVVTTTANQVEGDNQTPCASGQLSCGSGSVTIAAVPDGSGNLPRTGADVLRLALTALALLTAGLGLAVPATRRRRRGGQHDA